MDIVALVKLALQVWQAHHNGQIFPYVSISQLQRLPQQVRCTNPCTRSFTSFDTQNPLAFEAIEVLCKASAICLEVVPLNGEHKKGIEFIEGV